MDKIKSATTSTTAISVKPPPTTKDKGPAVRSGNQQSALSTSDGDKVNDQRVTVGRHRPLIVAKAAPSAAKKVAVTENNTQLMIAGQKVSTKDDEEDEDSDEDEDELERKRKAPCEIHKQISNLKQLDTASYFTEAYYEDNPYFPHDCDDCKKRFGTKDYKVGVARPVHICPNGEDRRNYCVFALCHDCFLKQMSKYQSPKRSRRGQNAHRLAYG